MQYVPLYDGVTVNRVLAPIDITLYLRDTLISMKGYIYFVGKPYPLPEAITSIRHLGYKVGLFLDKNLTIKHKDDYDSIVEMDFTSEATVLASLANQTLHVDGLICTYENYIVSKSVLADYFKVSAPSVASARMSTDKYLMRQAFMNADESITPQFGLVSSQEELLQLAANFTYPLIIKPTSLVKSLLVLRCNDEQELLKNYSYASMRIAELYKQYRIYDREPQIIVEEYITGKTCSIAAFVDSYGEPHFCDGIVGLTNAQDIGAADNYIYRRYLPADFDPVFRERLFDVATKGIKALSMKSVPAHVELIYNENEIKLIEIGARIGGYRPRMYELSYGINLIEQEVRLALGQLPDLKSSFKSYCSVYELFPDKEGEFIGINGELNNRNYNYSSLKAKPMQKVGPAKSGYKAVAVVIVSAAYKQTFVSTCATVDELQVKIT